MPNYKLTIQYDGTRLRGWQVQGNTNDTVQGILEERISELLGYPVELQGSGRTDAGVHAVGQVASMHTKGKLPEDFILEINKHLSEDIAIIVAEEVGDRFHARYSAVSKTYRYRIRTSPVSNVFQRKYIYTYTDRPLNVNLMKQAAAYMTGTHDFKAFCGNKRMKKSTERTVTAIEFGVNADGTEITIDFTGDGFLQNMIRIMVGTMIEVGNGSRNIATVPELVKGCDRELAGFTAPPTGLTLMKVEY